MKLHDVRLSTRITIAALLVVFAAGGLAVVIEQMRLRDAYISGRHADLEAGLYAEKIRLNQTIDTLRQDVLFLSRLPAVADIMHTELNRRGMRDAEAILGWEKRLGGVFAAFSSAHPYYYRIRYIGVSDQGHELVRIDNRNGHIEIAPPGRLEARADQDYVEDAQGVGDGQVGLSEFSLAQKSGEPSVSTLRAVTPVFSPSGKLFGLVVVNMDVRSLLESAVAGLPSDARVYISNMHGQYLLRPAQFSAAVNDSRLLASEEVHFDPRHPERFLLLSYAIPDSMVAQQISRMPGRSIVIGLIAMLLTSIIVLVVLRRMFTPLEQITVAADKIAAGEQNVEFPKNGGGEIGSLTNALNVMLAKLLQREQDIFRINEGLERQVKERTRELSIANTQLQEEVREREWADEIVRRENNFRKEMINSLPGIFYMMDSAGRLLLWNKNLESVLQISGEEIVDSSPLDFFEEVDRGLVEAKIREAFDTGENCMEAMLVARNGTRIPYYFTGRRIDRGDKPVLVGLGMDISEQKHTQRQTELLLRRNQALMSTSMDGIHVMDMQGNLVSANDAFCRMLGYTQEEITGLNVADWEAQWSGEALREKLQSLVGKSARFETVHRRKDGSLIDVEISTTGVDSDGMSLFFAAGRDITERKKVEQQLQLTQFAMDNAYVEIYWLDKDARIHYVNKQACIALGYTREELLDLTIPDIDPLVPADRWKTHWQNLRRNKTLFFETMHKRKDGAVFPVEVAANYVKFGDLEYNVAFTRDITERKKTDDALRIAAAAFETHEAIMITDANANIIRVNQAFSDITGYSAAEVLGKNPRIMSSGRHDKDFYAEMWQQLLSQGSWAGEIWDKRKNGQDYPRWMTITAVKNEQMETTQYVGIFSDITTRKQAEEEIRNLAFYDALTQLPNRRLFLDRFGAALSASARNNSYGAVLFIDLDRFKTLNDTLGHDYGDLLLVEVAARIKSCVREMDTAARLGGDEFVVLIEGVSDEPDEASHKVGLVAEKIRETLARSYRLNGYEHYSSPSIGVSLYLGNAEPVDVLLQHADMAMYQAKEAGRNTVRFFDPILQRKVVTHAALENDLRHAVAQQQLCLYFQVQVDHDHRPVGAEALLRWPDPQRGMMMPAQFLPVAEESSLILDIDHWVLETACRQLALWSGNEKTRELTLAVNVSAKQFVQPDFVDMLIGMLRTYRVHPARMKLELTEVMVLNDLTGTLEKMRALRAAGISLSMDDFGGGNSSLSYLKQLPLDQIKIAQSYVQGIELDGNDALLVGAIIDLAHSFNLNVIAEGVETEAQLAFLKHQDCMSYQGFMFGKAVPIEEFEALL